MNRNPRKIEYYAAANIAADPERYPGVMQEWAATVLNSSTELTAPGARRAA
jgi:hypothetical protein